MRHGYLFLLPILALLAVGAAPAANSVIVHGDGIEEWQWTTQRLQRELPNDIQSISYSVHGTNHTSHAIPLIAILQKGGIKTDLQMGHFADAKTKNQFLRLVVLIVGRDGYATAIDLADLLPTIGNKKVWIAIDADGKKFDEAHGPAQLIIPDDVKPVRWIRGIAEVRVVDVSPNENATTRPANQP